VKASLHQWMQDIASPIFPPEIWNRNYLNMKQAILKCNGVSQLNIIQNSTRNLFLTWVMPVPLIDLSTKNKQMIAAWEYVHLDTKGERTYLFVKSLFSKSY
jgi:hypothetical protein